MNTSSSAAGMRRYLRSGFFRAGLITLGVGWGPLLLLIAAAGLGLTRDPNPNPIGLGLLAVVTFWPGVILLGIGVVRAQGRSRSEPDVPRPIVERRHLRVAQPFSMREQLDRMLSSPIGRALAGVAGVLLCAEGAVELPGSDSRGPASLIALGFALLSCAALGRIPGWLSRSR